MNIVAFYEQDRVYGGPEEGGWWYDTGDLARPFRMARSQDEAYRLARRANHLLTLVQRRQRSVGSAIYDGGRFGAYVFVNELPAFFPPERPRYE